MGKTEQNILSERGRGMHFPLSVSCASPACYADQRHGDDYIGSHRKAQPLAGVQWNSWTLIHIIKTMIIAELWRAKRACGAHVTEHRPQPARPSALQENQCSISHFLASLVAQEDWYCTHILHINVVINWQVSKRGSADHYHLTVSRAQVATNRGRISFWSYPLTNY